MAITKPSGLRWILELINPALYIPPFTIKVVTWTIAHKGDWLTLRLPIGDTIEWALDGVLGLINTAIDEIWAAIRAIPHVLDLLGWVVQFVGSQIAGIWLQFLDVISWTAGQLWEGIRAAKREAIEALAWIASSLWEGIKTAKREVMDWTPGFVDEAIKAAFLPFRVQLNLIIALTDEMMAFLRDPDEWVLDKIEHMLVRFL